MVYALLIVSAVVALVLLFLVMRLTRLPERPRTLALAGGQIRDLWRLLRVVLVAALVVGVLAPLLAALVLQVGEDGRDNVCEVVERTFHEYSDLHTESLALVVTDPNDADDVAETNAAASTLLDLLHDGIVDLMAECS